MCSLFAFFTKKVNKQRINKKLNEQETNAKRETITTQEQNVKIILQIVSKTYNVK